MSNLELNGRKSTLLQRYQQKTSSQDPLQQPIDTAPLVKSTSQRSLQNSALLQKYYSKTTSQDLRSGSTIQPDGSYSGPQKSSSQRSLDQSKLLQRYCKQHSLDSQDVPKPEPQRFSSQKSLESSKLLRRYNPVNNSQEFTGLAVRESTPITRFTRSGSLDQDRLVRPSLLSKYTPRFGQSLDRNKAYGVSAYSNYSSQQSLDKQESQNLSQSQTLANYGSDHFDQYDTQNIRSRSSSLARGLARKSAQRELEPSYYQLEMEKENIPLEPVTSETLPLVASPEPVTGNIASALPMPMLSTVVPTPIVEISQPPIEPLFQPMQVDATRSVLVPPEPEKPKRKEPVKPPRKDLPPSTTVSIPIPTITTTITVDPPKSVTPTKQEAPVVPKEPSQPLFSNRDRMEHYGSASISVPSSSPPSSQKPVKSGVSQLKKNTLSLPISDISSRRSLNDLHKVDDEELNPFALEIDETSERHELHRFSKKRHPVKSTLASAFEQIAALSVPQARIALEDDEERIEALPPNRKLKKRDHTYHPTFLPKPSKLEEEQRKIEEKERHRIELDHKKEEERLKKQEDKVKRENEKIKKEEDKRKKEDEKRAKAEEEKRRKEEEKIQKENEKKIKEEEKRKKDEEKKRLKLEKKKGSSQASQGTDQESAQVEEEPIDFGSHLEQYTSVGPSLARSATLGRPHGSHGALNQHNLLAPSKPIYGSQQSLDRSGGVQSRMMQRYAKRTGSQEFITSTIADEAQQFIKDVHRSQGSLDQQRLSRSTLLQKYTPKPLSASSAAPVQPAAHKSTSQVSLNKTRIEKSSLLQRYNKPSAEPVELNNATAQSDNDQRMSAVMFHQKKRSEKYSEFDYRDHEYEPIGEPADKSIEAKPPTSTSATLALPSTDQKRKLSTASLRVPGDEGDTISMEELQRNIEDRYFNRIGDEEQVEVAVESVPEKASKMKAVMTRAQESGKKAMARAQESGKHAMNKAQQGSKTLHQKLRKQTDKFRTKVTNINIKKDKDVAPLASPEIVTTPEIEALDFTLAEPKTEQETGEREPAIVKTAKEEDLPSVERETTHRKFKAPEFSKIKNIHMPKIQKPEFKRPEFTKISKPKIPKIKGPDISKFKRPEIPKFLTEKPDFSKLKMPEKIGAIRLQRSKSMKEPDISGTASVTSPSDAEAETVKTKISYTDFSTYPRILDKFKRSKTTDSNVSARASTPPPLEFTKVGKTTRSKGAVAVPRWTEKSSEDASSNRYFSGSELGERESSVERQMRQRLERIEFEAPELAVTAEQKQLEEYDKENREIHILSAARHDEFLRRKPPMERQESDLASEEEKQFWASSLGQKIRQNIDMNSNDFDFLDEDERLRAARENEAIGLSEQDRARFLGETMEPSEKDYDMRSTTPYSNKECQSSGSSGIRRRKGVLEEIDDDEFFLRQKGISKDNIQMGEYISSAIKEGLSTPKNALAEMGRYDSYYDEDMDVSERMSLEYRADTSTGGMRYYQPSIESDDVSNKQAFVDEFRRNTEFYKTFPPDRPTRKHKKTLAKEQHLEGDQKVLHQDKIHVEDEERFIDDENAGNELSSTGAVVPPTPPRRRKKRFRDVTPSYQEPFENGLTAKPIYNSFIIGPETHLFQAEIPLAQEENFTTPLLTPRRSRSRSQLSKPIEEDRISRGAESYTFGAEESAMVKHTIHMSESNGYAIVRKEPPPRPPAPIRRRKSTRSLGDQRQFSTLPNYHSVLPVRPSRNYSTISPNRPPRGRSISSLNENQLKSTSISKEEITQYEEIEDDMQTKFHHTLHSGAIVSKMKDRPLPPPPRPPRDGRKARKFDHEEDRYDFDGGAERVVVAQLHETRYVEEVEIAVQTDPLPDDYELDIEVSEAIGAVPDKPMKTLEDILKQEQQAEIDRARQLAEASNLMRDIQKFRDSTSSLSLHGSRPETPAAMALEHRHSAPTSASIRESGLTSLGLGMEQTSNENLTEQDLANADDDNYIAELVKKYVSEEKVSDASRKLQKGSAGDEVDATKLQNIESIILSKEEVKPVQSEPAAPPRRRSLVGVVQDTPKSIEIPTNVIEEIVERLRSNEQQHIAELQQLHRKQLDNMLKSHEEQKIVQEQKLEVQQKQLLEQQNQQLHETQQLKEQILQQQEQQKTLLQQQQQQQQQLLLAQQQQQLLLQQQEKERELQRERERELLREREIELEKARERERELHHARELELQRARELEQQRAKEIEQQRVRELELQRTMELEHQRLRELEMQRAQEAEVQRAREAELARAREADIQRARESEIQRIRDIEMQRIRELELLKEKEAEIRRAKESESLSKAARDMEAKAPDFSKDIHENESSKPTAVDQEDIEKQPEISITSQLTETIVTQTPARPPPPRITPHIPISSQFPYQEYLPYTLPQQPFYPTRNFSDEEAALPQPPQRRRKHHRSRRESTSEEEYQREQRKQRHGTRSPEPSIPALSSQLIRACGSSIRQRGDELMTILRASSKDENKRDLHIALIILIVIVAGLMALGMSGEKAVHHHHWDYFNPPSDSGNA